MPNTVVITDYLGKFPADDSLRFNGISSVAQRTALSGVGAGDFYFRYDGTLKYAPFTPAVFSHGGAFAGGKRIALYIASSTQAVVQMDDDVTLRKESIAVDVSSVERFELERIGSNCEVFINGVSVLTFTESKDCSTTQPLSIGAWYNVPTGQFDSFSEMECTYFAIGTSRSNILLEYLGRRDDYGTATLIDHSGNGNDATLVDTQWWKKGVDQHFLTRDAYKSQWPIPMEDDQLVYTDTANYLPASDTYWYPYNQDPTYQFNVINFSLYGSSYDQDSISYSFGYSF